MRSDPEPRIATLKTELALERQKRMLAERQATQLRRAVRMMRAQIERLIADPQIQKMDADNR
jgi:hypothetical protein